MHTGDGSIIQKCLDGEPEAFGLLVDKYKVSVYALAYSKLHDFHDAQDITQEVFLKAYQNLRTLKRYDRFHAWLYAITSNLCKNRLRAKASQPDREFVADQDSTHVNAQAINIYQEERLHESLHEALDSLTEMYQQVLTLYYLGGMNSEEIAQFLGTSPAAIRQRLSRARSQLREEMLATMTTGFEQNQLHPSFTFHVVERVKQTEIQPVPRAPWLPWGLSLGAGLILALLSFSPYRVPLTSVGDRLHWAIPGEMEVAEVGELPVEFLNASEMSHLSEEPADRNESSAGSLEPENALVATARRYAPHPPKGGWLDARGRPGALAQTSDDPHLDAELGGELTIEAWLYLRRRPEAHERWTVLSKGGSYSMEVVGWPGVPVIPTVRISAGGATVVSRLDIGEWQHVAGVFKRNGVDHFNAGTYRNGRLLGHQIPAMGRIADTRSPIEVGANFDGAIDQIRISKVARYTVREQDPFQPPADLFVPDEHTVVLWQFEDGETAQQFRDDSGSGHHLTPQGGIWISEATLENDPDIFAPEAQAWFQETKLKVLATSQTRRFCDIFLLDGADLSIRNLTGTPKQVERGGVAWSPDGRRIAFVRYENLGTGSRRSDLVVMDVETRHVTRLTHSELSKHSPDWSPDGKRIAFAGGSGGGESSHLFVVDVLHREVEQLTHGPGSDGNPKWSPDGQQIAFISSRSGHREIYLMDSKGEQQRQITHHQADIISAPSWSPEGGKLVYSYLVQGQTVQMMLADIVANRQTRVVIESAHGLLNAWDPVWLPDGRHLAFSGGSAVYRVDVNGGNLTPILYLPSNYGFLIGAWYGGHGTIGFAGEISE